jgi:hypothetical protein
VVRNGNQYSLGVTVEENADIKTLELVNEEEKVAGIGKRGSTFSVILE